MTTPATNAHFSGPRIFHPDTSPRQARLCQSPSSFSHSLGFKLDLSNLLVSGTLVGPIIKGPADCSIAKRSFLAGLEQVCPVHLALPPILSGFRLLAFLRVNPYLLLNRIPAILGQVSTVQLCVFQTLD